MTFKYAAAIARFTDCPPNRYSNQEREVFRFVQTDPPDARSFLPVTIRDAGHPFAPDGALAPREFADDADGCRAWALSLWTTEAKARRKHAELRSKYPELKVGDFLARGRVLPDDGVMGRPSASGHLSLHEYEASDLAPRFSVIGRLSP
jgi:hypothetical protein